MERIVYDMLDRRDLGLEKTISLVPQLPRDRICSVHDKWRGMLPDPLPDRLTGPQGRRTLAAGGNPQTDAHLRTGVAWSMRELMVAARDRLGVT